MVRVSQAGEMSSQVRAGELNMPVTVLLREVQPLTRQALFFCPPLAKLCLPTWLTPALVGCSAATAGSQLFRTCLLSIGLHQSAKIMSGTEQSLVVESACW